MLIFAEAAVVAAKTIDAMRETIREMRRRLVPRLGAGEAQAVIRLIFRALKGWNTVDMIVNEDKPLSDYIRGKADEMTGRVMAGEPVQYVTGMADFHGLVLKVDRRVLIPRPETSELVDIICDRSGGRADLRVADVCTGSGCIAVALGRSLPFARITAIDNSADALEVARDNARDLRVDVRLVHADVFDWQPPREAFDIMVSNPPYIDMSERAGMEATVTGWEPAGALFVPDDDPLRYYRRIADIGTRSLAPGGTLYFEINPRHASELVSELGARGYGDVALERDIHGRERFCIARRPAGE